MARWPQPIICRIVWLSCSFLAFPASARRWAVGRRWSAGCAEGKQMNGRSIWCKAESNLRDKPLPVACAKGRETFTKLMIAYMAAHPEAEFNTHRKADNLQIDWSEPCRSYFDDKCGSGPKLIFHVGTEKWLQHCYGARPSMCP